MMAASQGEEPSARLLSENAAEAGSDILLGFIRPPRLISREGCRSRMWLTADAEIGRSKALCHQYLLRVKVFLSIKVCKRAVGG